MKKVKFDKPVMVSSLFTQLCLVFSVALIASNIFETKQIDSGIFDITGGLLIFPICYIISDIVTEIWGYRNSMSLILAGFVLNFLFIGVAALVDILPGADTWAYQEGFHAIFGLSARITMASCLAFLAGGYLNVLVMSRMKERSNGERLGSRLILSSVAGEAADSLIFFPVAFIGVLPGKTIVGMMVMQFILKTLYELILLPVTIRLINRFKAKEAA